MRYLFILLLLTACTTEMILDPLPENVTQTEVIRNLFDQNTAMRGEIDTMRDLLFRYESELTAQNDSLKAYYDHIRLDALYRDQPSPHMHIPIEDIKVYSNEVVISVAGIKPSTLSDTKSMDPTADSTSKILVLAPKSEREIFIGDIIGYRHEGDLIMHRVIGIGKDNEGLYYTLKGDNNPLPDSRKVRFNEVETLVVGIIY